jgi:hypothetical protein
VSDAASAGARDIPLGVRRRARRLAWAYLIVAVGLIVWTVFLALSLPKENLEHHYRLTWTGFDLIATLLVADAWFDVTTSATAADATQALILALLVELPAAAFSLYVAHRVVRRVRRLANAASARQVHKPRLRGRETDIEHELVGDEHAIQSDGRHLTRQVTKVTQHRVRGLGFLIVRSDQQAARIH